MLLLLSHFSHVWLCAMPWTAAHQAPPSLGFSRQEYWSGLPFPSPMPESEKGKWSSSVLSDSQRPHGLQPTRLLHPWSFPGKSTGVGCHCLLHMFHVNCYQIQALPILYLCNWFFFLLEWNLDLYPFWIYLHFQPHLVLWRLSKLQIFIFPLGLVTFKMLAPLFKLLIETSGIVCVLRTECLFLSYLYVEASPPTTGLWKIIRFWLPDEGGSSWSD